jgi:hypothetical protein
MPSLTQSEGMNLTFYNFQCKDKKRCEILFHARFDYSFYGMSDRNKLQ